MRYHPQRSRLTRMLYEQRHRPRPNWLFAVVGALLLTAAAVSCVG